jgi:hypothetical protein
VIAALPLLAAALVGCGAPSGPPPTDGGDPQDAVPWVLPATTSTGVDLDSVLATAQYGVELLPSIDPEPVLAAYRDLAAGADPDCPAVYADDDVDYWLDSCTSAAGTRFDGFGLDDALTVVDGAAVYDVEATGGAAEIEASDGTFLALDGYVQRIEQESYGVLVTALVLTGAFATNHPAADGTWLGDGVEPTLAVSRYSIGGATVLIGAVGALDQLPGDNPSVAFDDAAILDPSIGYGGCALEPTGVVSVRLPTGDWVDVVFDPILQDDGNVLLDDPAACDGCGAAWHRADPLGPVCLDFSTWLLPGGA